MKLTKQQYNDLIATRDFWEYASKNICKNKKDWHEYNRIQHLENLCFFCEFFESCINCYLYIHNICGRIDYPYDNWLYCYGGEDNREYAKNIFLAIENFIKNEVEYEM